MSKKLFDFAIGNPPYNAEFGGSGENDTYAAPVYHTFMDAANEVSDKVELIHPARFLFDAGSTPKEWNQKMLNDPHFKVLKYEENASTVFPNTEIKGGIAITYHDDSKDYNPIVVFTKYPELNSILHKVTSIGTFVSINSNMYIQNCFNLEAMYKERPEYKQFIGSKGKDRRFETGIFSKIDDFKEQKTLPNDIRVLGVVKNKRTWRYFPERFTDLMHANLRKYKVIISKSSGSGLFGETLTSPVIEEPNEAYTRTFISIGAFDIKSEAENAAKYFKGKFFRTMLGVLKTTQHAPVDTYKYVPLQDFTENSDIDWSKSVHEIDLQLYRKYGLSVEEIKFIETHVKEMV